MKKLVVTMCAAVCGLAMQASTVSWSFSWATDASGNDLPDGSTAYLMAESIMTAAAADAALTAKTFDTSKALDSATTANNGNGAEVSQTSPALTLTGSQTFYAVIVSGDNYGITSTVTKDVATIGNTVVPFAELSDENGVSAMTWKPGGIAGGSSGGGGGGSGGVPEPTSGLLLLGGGAMLALRRKQK